MEREEIEAKAEIYYTSLKRSEHFPVSESITKSFIEGYQQALEERPSWDIKQLINYIENDAEIAIPCNELMNEDRGHLTKKEYGLVLLKHLVIELRNKFIPNPKENS